MEKLIRQVEAVLQATPERWRALCEALPAELLQRRPKPGEWSAAECLRHLVQTESVFSGRIRGFLASETQVKRFDPDAALETASVSDVGQLAEQFAELRRETLRLLGQVREEDLGRRAQHEEYGPVTLGNLLHEYAAHDLNHTMQAERALAQPFVQGAGGWRRSLAGIDDGG
ncbi:MAG: DinB family protein [Candidatus Dormibacteraeota bacterium]|uniref:DinB family protein n=1 Tax=Candidatus Dormiibacter inghamiae TaxID=3127013 RepID=A0A934K916_9BACT|nr:DinB family protein [Candidatus Dormibacteraeota bacterium]MBJ7605954.1 DinB family protein [Candidatus Dormibacteraeota bacterium]